MNKGTIAAVLLGIAAFSLGSDLHAQPKNLPNLRGTWYCKGPCQVPDGSTYIDQNSPYVTLYNEVGEISQGRFSSNNTIVAYDWGNLAGTLSADNQVIQWANGTRWARKP